MKSAFCLSSLRVVFCRGVFCLSPDTVLFLSRLRCIGIEEYPIRYRLFNIHVRLRSYYHCIRSVGCVDR